MIPAPEQPKRRGRPTLAGESQSILTAPPVSADIVYARTTAGLSQEAAAELVGLSSRLSWWRAEMGTTQMDPARWALFLLATGQHPTLTLRPR